MKNGFVRFTLGLAIGASFMLVGSCQGFFDKGNDDQPPIIIGDGSVRLHIDGGGTFKPDGNGNFYLDDGQTSRDLDALHVVTPGSGNDCKPFDQVITEPLIITGSSDSGSTTDTYTIQWDAANHRLSILMRSFNSNATPSPDNMTLDFVGVNSSQGSWYFSRMDGVKNVQGSNQTYTCAFNHNNNNEKIRIKGHYAPK